MKRYTLYTLSALALLLAAAACTQDDAVLLPEAPEGIPMTFTATGLNPTAATTTGTRAPVDGDWEGVTAVAIQIGSEVKAYRVNPSADNLTVTLSSDDPHYWTGGSSVTVSAWCPYTEGETSIPAVVVQADQSGDGYAKSDHIGVAEQQLDYDGGTPTLAFTHRTARIVVTVSGTSNISSVHLTNLSTADGNPGEIIAHHAGSGIIYEALVAPQSVAQGTAFITITTADGKTYAYRMQGAAEWKAGEEYTYTVSLAAAYPGYTDDGNGNYTVTSAEGLKNIAKLVNEEWKSDINITLTADIDLSGTNWTPIGIDDNHQYTGTFDGGNHTITGLTVTTSDRYAGLFGCIGSGGKVKNVKLKDVKIESDNGTSDVGGVAGWSYGNIENCSVSGSVSGSGMNGVAGGVVGFQVGGSLTECSSSATVNAGCVAGGVAGLTDRGATLTACYATGDVTLESINSGGNFVGGVVGVNTSCTLKACYAWGSVTGSKSSGTVYVGGVTGQNVEGTLQACYHAKGAVKGPNGTTGGVTGQNYKFFNDPVITACYWGDNGQEQGIGEDQVGTGGTTKVDGTDVTWRSAMTSMNEALQSAGSAWSYTIGEDFLPTLEQGQQ